jgi:hypothetical protein
MLLQSITPKDGDIISWGNGITSAMKEEYKLVLKNGSNRFEEICGVDAKMITQQTCDEEHPINRIDGIDGEE